MLKCLNTKQDLERDMMQETVDTNSCDEEHGKEKEPLVVIQYLAWMRYDKECYMM